ncbi:MAG: PocR ligand-binding domain-containing protein [Candidatus Scatosoma sp.]
MKIKFNQKKIDALLNDFYTCTKIPVSLYDTRFNCIYVSIEMPTYCKNIRSTKGLEDSCALCDEVHFKEVNRTKNFHCYTCHAGICEVIAPIMHDDIVIAYIMLGRFRDKERTFSSIKFVREFTKKHGLDLPTQTDAYYKLPLFSEQEIHASFNIVKSLIHFIWAGNLISTHKDLLPQKIEQYIEQNLTSNILTVEHLCRTFFISKSTLYNLFHKEFQDTLRNYILKKRLQLAEKILLGSNLTITQISGQCGFTDYNYFTRAFTKKYGISPTKFRKENVAKSTVR